MKEETLTAGEAAFADGGGAVTLAQAGGSEVAQMDEAYIRSRLDIIQKNMVEFFNSNPQPDPRVRANAEFSSRLDRFMRQPDDEDSETLNVIVTASWLREQRVTVPETVADTSPVRLTIRRSGARKVVIHAEYMTLPTPLLTSGRTKVGVWQL